MNFGKIAVLYGGDSAEREVSLNSGQAVYEALLSKGVDAHLVDTHNRQAVLRLKEDGFERAFVMLHGRGGEDGQIQGVLEWLEIPYTGSGILACALAMDKMMTKQVWAREGLPVLPDAPVSPESTYEDLVEKLGATRFAVKPALEGSSVGISQVSHADELVQAKKLAGVGQQKVMAEAWVTGRELTCAMIDGEVLPAIEIIASTEHEFYDYEAKYLADDTRYLCPAPIAPALAETLASLTQRAFAALGARGWGRVDFMLDEENRPWLLEINLAPGMTSHSLVPQAAKVVGMSFADLVWRVLALTVEIEA